MSGERVSVMALKPFWRWALIPEGLLRQHSAISFYRRKNAEAMAREFAANESVFSTVLLFRKRWFSRTVEEVARIKP